MLLRSSPQGGFNPNIWVGPADSTQARMWVKGTRLSSVGGQSALTAAVSGNHVGTIASISEYLNYPDGTLVGPLVAVTGVPCTGGDSGAPWYSATSGYAYAKGQHTGFKTISGTYYCLYSTVQQIATALTATIATQ
jgi:hypothetical protein